MEELDLVIQRLLVASTTKIEDSSPSQNVQLLVIITDLKGLAAFLQLVIQ